MISISWTTEQLLSLAPDVVVARAAERIAAPREWLALGRAGDAIWGEFPNPNKPPYHVLVSLPDLALSCDCTARKVPCRHALSLALLLAGGFSTFSDYTQNPPWVAERMAARERPSPPPALYPDAAALEAYQRRLAAVRGGMAQLRRWLKDVVHNGLADLPAQPVTPWSEMAARLSEAQIPEVAAELRELRQTVGKQAGWPQTMLRRLGRLYLLALGFAGYEALPPETQADLRAAAGWFEDPSFPGDERLRDRWLVLGAAHRLLGSHDERRTWLYGVDSRRFAFVCRQANQQEPQPALLSGATLAATLRFAPGAWPGRAYLETLESVAPDGVAVRGYDSLRAARAAYGRALSLNPWLRVFPLLLSGVRCELDGELWVLRDREGYVLPLPQPFLYGWHLQVLGAAAGSALFGEWDGRSLTPLALYKGGWLALPALRGQK